MLIREDSTVQCFAESELHQMKIHCDSISLINDKDGVSVWRVISGDDSYVMKCFDKPEYRREIANYQTLISLSVPTLKMFAYTDCSILLEDIEQSIFRLGNADDLNNPSIAELIAKWYILLHENGRDYANSHLLYDECDALTVMNMVEVKEKTGTSDINVWQVLEDNFDAIKSTAMRLPRTLTYNDFFYTNLAVSRDGSSAIVFDYNLLGKGYVYSDIRNVCSSLGDESAAAFLSAYGGYDKTEIIIDDVVSPLLSLHVACQLEVFPDWASDSLEMVRDGRLKVAVEKLLDDYI